MILYAHKYNLSHRTWSAFRVPFRNTILQALYPELRLAILQASTNPADYDTMLDLLAAEADGAAAGLFLDFATGARKRGEFIATDSRVSRRFWDTPEQAAAYGSNLLTDCCQPPIATPLRVRVVEDGEYSTGDCHAKMGLGLAYELIPPASKAQRGGQRGGRAAQFRLVYDHFLAKGTMVVPNYDLTDYDLIIPLSAFKSSQKPSPGLHAWSDAVIGVQGWSERRRVKLSYTVLQWFSRRAIEHDVLPHVERQIARLLEAGRSVQAAAQLLHLSETDPDDPDEQLLARIIAADAHSLLGHHPWIVNALSRMLRRRWLHLALGGGLKFVGLQALPDDSLPLGVISTPDLPAGPIIATRYPVRSWADLRLWHNIRQREHRGQKGVVWMSHATAALVGGDFDGDYFNFLPAADYPAMTAEIRRWRHTRQEPPVVKVKERRASAWDQLPRVMMGQTDNMVGLITFFIAQACAQGRLDLVDRLAPELQIAVDKFKYNLTHDHDEIAAISEQLESLAWLADRKSRAAFTQRPLHVDGHASDTISHLARHVAAAWEPPNLLAAPLESFAPLFPEPVAHKDTARELARRYGRQVAAVIRSGDRDGFSPIFHALHEWAETRTDPDAWAAAVWRAVHRKGRQACPERRPEQCPELVEGPAEGQSRRNTGSLAFHAFPAQLIARLQGPQQVPDQACPACPERSRGKRGRRVAIVGLAHHECAEDLAQFDGQPHQACPERGRRVTITHATLDGQLRQLASVSGRTLGLVSNETPLPPGTYILHLTWNGSGVVYATP